MRRYMRRRGTETVEFTIAFAAFLAMFALLIVVIIVFANAIAAQRALNEYAVGVGSTGITTVELDGACRQSFKPISPGTAQLVQCDAFPANGTNSLTTLGSPCRAGDRIRVRLRYSQQYLPESLANLVGIPAETELVRTMIVPSQSSRGKSQCS